MRRLLQYSLLTLLFVGCTTYQPPMKENPCKDKYLLQLEQKSELTPEEMLAYAELRRNCIENENSKTQTEIMEFQADMIHLGVMVYVSTIIGVLIWAATK